MLREKSKKKTTKKKDRWSSWFLKSFCIALIGYVFYKGIPAFIEYKCMKCALPTLGIGGLISAIILAALNEVKNYIGK